jgi:polysaccharide biosynthesis transport protein
VGSTDEQSLGESARPFILPQEHLSYLQTQVDILTSRTVARKVVQDLRLLESPKALAALGVQVGQGHLEDRLIEHLLNNLKTENSQSNVIYARFSCADSGLSATIANGFATAYIETMLELRVAPTRQAAAWFDEQLKSLRANLEDAQAKLSTYRQQVVSRYIAQSGSPDNLPEVWSNTVIQQLKADTLRGDAKLKDLATRFGVNHPEYQRAVAENAALHARLDTEIRETVAGIAASARQRRPRDAELQHAWGTQRTGVIERAGVLDSTQRDEFTVLQLNVESAERAYDAAMQRRVVSQIDSRASEANVAILSPAAVPLTAYRPNIALNVALSVLSGILFGAALVALLESRDRRVRSIEDLLIATQLPLLAVLGNEGRRPAILLPRGPAAGPVRSLPRLT